jgi:hypothetical protein
MKIKWIYSWEQRELLTQILNKFGKSEFTMTDLINAGIPATRAIMTNYVIAGNFVRMKKIVSSRRGIYRLNKELIIND